VRKATWMANEEAQAAVDGLLLLGRIFRRMGEDIGTMFDMLAPKPKPYLMPDGLPVGGVGSAAWVNAMQPQPMGGIGGIGAIRKATTMTDETSDPARLAKENAALRTALDAHRQAIQVLYAVVPAEAQFRVEIALVDLEARVKAMEAGNE